MTLRSWTKSCWHWTGWVIRRKNDYVAAKLRLINEGPMIKTVPLALLVLVLAACSSIPDKPQTTNARHIAELASADWRSPENIALNKYRHPWRTLSFFGLEPDMTVVEVWPGEGWYTEILAQYLRDRGRLYVAGVPLRSAQIPDVRRRTQRQYNEKLNARPELYSAVNQTALGPPQSWWIAPPGTVDLVLTFRDVHDWVAGGYAPRVFDAFYEALKPGGVLGVVAYRAEPGTDRARMMQSGYVTVAYVKKLAANAGFEFVAARPINANGDDGHQHPAGPQTLPPTLALGQENRQQYLEIGAPDRMTLKFRK